MSSVNCLALILLCMTVRLNAQEYDYPQVFGKDWERAILFEQQNRYWMQRMADSADVSYPFAVAIVFPELVRYSALRDKMETTLLKTLYVSIGEEYANFSIGHFQMKPSFAESIRELVSDSQAFTPNLLRTREYFDGLTEYRKDIISDLQNMRSQMYYLLVFIKICEKRFSKQIDALDPREKLRFFSLVYNSGPLKTADEIRDLEGLKFFTTSLIGGDRYLYSDISLFWYSSFVE